MARGLIPTVFIIFFRLLYAPLPLVVVKRLKSINHSTPLYPILAATASAASQLTLQEAILLPLYMYLVVVAFAIARTYSFIYRHHELDWIQSIPPSVTYVHKHSAKTQDYDASGRARLKSGMFFTKRGSRKPAIQCPPVPIYIKEQLVQSPTGEQASQIPDTLAGNVTKDSKTRGRREAVVRPSSRIQTHLNQVVSAVGQSTPDPSTQPANIPAKHKEVRKTLHSKGRTGGVFYPSHRTLDRDFRSPEPTNTLFGSLKGFLTFKSPKLPNIPVHILGVGLSWSHVKERELPGPGHDIRWLQGFFAYQHQFHFTPLLDEQATFDAIYQNVAHIYSNADPSSYVILYFTGHGNGRNAFELYDKHRGSLDEVILNEWIVELRRKTSKRIPVYIIFDFCRDSLDRSDAQLDDDVTVIRSCPPGQQSPDLKLCEDLPYSCFLLALLLAIYDGSKHHTSSSMETFSYRLMELFNVIWGIRGYRPNSWRRKRWCRHPQSCRQCRDQRHNSRDDVWPDLQLFEALEDMHLGELPDFQIVAEYASTRFPLPIRKAHERLESNQWFMYFNPIRIDTNKGSSTPQSRRFLPHDVHAVSKSTMMRGRTLPLGAMSTPTTSK
ncbi:hypothetical protein ACGC1H_002704 [Rhizoctonia solani]